MLKKIKNIKEFYLQKKTTITPRPTPSPPLFLDTNFLFQTTHHYSLPAKKNMIKTMKVCKWSQLFFCSCITSKDNYDIIIVIIITTHNIIILVNLEREKNENIVLQSKCVKSKQTYRVHLFTLCGRKNIKCKQTFILC